MFGNVLGIFTVNVISFGLFFFAVPYWTGKEMSDISKSGFYRFFYSICSSIGDLFYKLIESINKGIAYLLNIHPNSIWFSVINIGSYVLLITTCSELYNSLMLSVIHVEPGEFKYIADTSFSKLSNVWLILGIASQFSDINGIGEFFAAIGNSIFAICFFLIVTIIYFSILYGILKHKLDELHPFTAENRSSSGLSTKLLAKEIPLNSWRSLIEALLQKILQFADNFVLLRNLQIGKSALIFLYLMLMFSCIEAYSGKTPEFLDLLMDFLDESDIINTVGSFIISFLLAKAAAYGCHKVYETLPETVQQKIDTASDRLNETVTLIQMNQQSWAEENDAIYAASEGIEFVYKSRAHKEPKNRREDPPKPRHEEPHPPTQTVTKMDLSTPQDPVKPPQTESRPKWVNSIDEAYAEEIDYMDGEKHRWTFRHGVLFDIQKNEVLVLARDGTISVHKLQDNPWRISIKDLPL